MWGNWVGLRPHSPASQNANTSNLGPDLRQSLLWFYTNQGLLQVYRVLGSAQFLGNPVGLVNHLGDGIYDLFYEPARALVDVQPGQSSLPLRHLGFNAVRETVLMSACDAMARFHGRTERGHPKDCWIGGPVLDPPSHSPVDLPLCRTV